MGFSEKSGHLVGIMGCQWCRKIDLFSILFNGTNTPKTGSVYINNIDIHKEKKRLRGLLALFRRTTSSLRNSPFIRIYLSMLSFVLVITAKNSSTMWSLKCFRVWGFTRLKIFRLAPP
jgi:ABC-type branched-subunit amino acid transport system ATPase component